MTDITFQDIEAEVRRLVSENPDFIYPQGQSANSDIDPLFTTGCFYNGEHNIQGKACIFGQALANLGEPVPINLEGASIESVLLHIGIPSSTMQGRWATEVQECQDRLMPWGKAIDLADRVIKET